MKSYKRSAEQKTENRARANLLCRLLLLYFTEPRPGVVKTLFCTDVQTAVTESVTSVRARLDRFAKGHHPHLPFLHLAPHGCRSQTSTGPSWPR